IGSPAMNFIPGTFSKDAVETEDGTRLPLGPLAGFEEGRRVVYGIRPEHFALGRAGGHEAVKAVVKVVEPTGADTLVYAALAGCEICAVFTERHAFRPEETIWLKPLTAKVHLFDATDGKGLSP
ncbi:MAG TPA: TOBE domain-containing protein, partial [Stellaceae bacterium]|nr:TOBE domain-containing protein [Stellaceae bacterium]